MQLWMSDLPLEHNYLHFLVQIQHEAYHKSGFFHNSGSFEGWRQIRFHPVFNTLIIKNFLSIFASVRNSQSWEHGRKYSSDNSLNWRLIQYTKKSQVFLLKKKCYLLNFMTQISIRNWTKENLFILARRRRDLGSKLLQKILLDVCYARGAPCISCALFKASYPAHTEQNVMWPPVSCQLIGLLTRPFCSAVK